MKNLIVVGDSFCANPGWPQELARLLDLNLLVGGFGGQHWWSYKNFLDNLTREQLDNTALIVFTHTFTQRIPNLNAELGKVDFYNPDPKKEIDQAVTLYFKHIHNDEYGEWAQQQWFKEIKAKYSSKTKTIHLHAFPWTWAIRDLLGGMQVSPDLSSISLDEIASKEFRLVHDSRANHFSSSNNKTLAQELERLYRNYSQRDETLDISKFDLKSTKWIKEHSQ